MNPSENHSERVNENPRISAILIFGWLCQSKFETTPPGVVFRGGGPRGGGLGAKTKETTRTQNPNA